MIDIAATVQIVKKRNESIIVVVDNTFLTCYLQRPLDFGADIVVYSLTKYVNGHSDVVMGAAVVNKQEIADNLRYIQECECEFINFNFYFIHIIGKIEKCDT